MKNAEHRPVENYANNPLIDACGPILSPIQTMARLTYFPPYPCNAGKVEHHIRLHQLGSVNALHIPTQESIQVASTIDFLLRQSYVPRKPTSPSTWRDLYDEPHTKDNTLPSPLLAAVFGISGVGKTRAIEKALALYPQTFLHDQFPSIAGHFKQVLWLKVDVPGSGKSIDLAEQLMLSLDHALGSEHFESILQSSRKNGPQMLRAWQQKAKSHFLGILVLDEIQNFFKLATKRARQTKLREENRLALRIVEDEALKFVLTLANTSGIAIVAAGTPDGMAAFSTRFSMSQRLITGGFHKIPQIASPNDFYFKQYMFPKLFEYQWFDKKLAPSDELRKMMFDWTGGVQRIISCLWFFAQRCVLERKAKSLAVEDFVLAMNTYMSPLRPAIEALQSNDPNKLSRYEDLLPNQISLLQ